jgi:hypothetical protein
MAILIASLFYCQTVHSYDQMADIRIGWPFPFLSVKMQRYTPLVFPQCFRMGSPWEDPMRVLWPALALNATIIFGSLRAVAFVLRKVRRKA